MASHILTASIIGLDAHPVQVETDISPGLGSFTVVGLPDAAVQEARERVRSSLKHADIPFPRTRVTVNLAPANLKKSGTPFDLPIALAILTAQGDLPTEKSHERLYAGELGLDGSLRPIRGALSFALLAKSLGIQEVVLPKENTPEAALVQGVVVRKANTLREVIDFVSTKQELPEEPWRTIPSESKIKSSTDFSMIRGQEQAKRAMEIAAAGGHNLLMQGPPGSGKTLLARAFSTILPALTTDEALEATRVHSVADLLPKEGVVFERPFRSPHHTASSASIVGGGTIPRPGEVSLAHRGVLFLDEFPEFSRTVIEGLRQPLEDGRVTVCRAHGSIEFPAKFILLAAMNPCPCGYLTDPDHACTCSPVQILKYQKRLSGPLLDRVDLFIEVPKVKTKDLTGVEETENSQNIRKRVVRARERQQERWKKQNRICNAELSSDEARRLIKLTPEAKTILEQAIERFHLSARAYFRLLKVAQTVADLEASDAVSGAHAAESLLYRQPLTRG